MRPSFLYPLFASPSSVRGVGDKYAALLENLGIGKIIDLLWHLPYAVNDRRRTASVHALKNGEINTVLIRVIEHIAPKSRKQPYQVLCEDEAGNELTLVFFKAYPDSIRKNLPEGCERLVSGKTELFNGRWQMSPSGLYRRPGKRLADSGNRTRLRSDRGNYQQIYLPAGSARAVFGTAAARVAGDKPPKVPEPAVFCRSPAAGAPSPRRQRPAAGRPCPHAAGL